MNNLISIISLLGISFCLNAKTRITSIEFNRDNDVGKIVVFLKQPILSSPKLVIKDKIIQVVVPNASVWPKIQKKISLNKNLDAQILAYQYTKDTVRVRAVLPYNIKNIASKVNLVEKQQSIEVFFPILLSNPKDTLVSKLQLQDKDSYDESYLELLLNDKKNSTYKKEKAYLNTNKESIDQKKHDVVKLKMSGQDKRPRFSVLPYLGKFTVFLGLMLLSFFIIVSFLKKGVFNRGKSGLLGNKKTVEVLHKTFIAPKRSIMTIKAYNQILLIGVDEKGMHFLTEIKTPIDFLKDSERQITSDNFDTNVESASSKGKKFNIKEVLNRPAESNEKDKIRFSERIKNKVKDLKSLQ